MRIAILGATGAVGRTMLQVLEEQGFGSATLVPLASARSAGTALRFGGRQWPVREPTEDAFADCAIALFSAGAERSLEWAPVAARQGTTVIDNSSAWRMDDGVPLVVPEVNAAALDDAPKRIIANPNCATIQLVIALEALRRARPLRRVVATTFQSVSGAGQQGSAALEAELAGGHAADSPFVATIAGNVLPWIGARGADGWNEEERKIRAETRRILGLPELEVAATCVRVPVSCGHCIAVAVELEGDITLAAARAALDRMPGLVLAPPDRDPLPLAVAGRDDVHVGHVRSDADRANVVHLWVVADNLRKGAATNAVQIAAHVLAREPAGSRG